MADDFGPNGVYSNIPRVDSQGRSQLPMFLRWNADPVGNDAKNLSSLSSDMQRVIIQARNDNPNLNFVIGNGRRSAEDQDLAKSWGWSKVGSKDGGDSAVHMNGNAADLWGLDSQGRVQFNPDQQKQISQAMQDAAQKLGVGVNWGGNFKNFKDAPHFELAGGGTTALTGPEGPPALHGSPLSTTDRDYVIRTVAGEADHPGGDAAVAAVIRNRLQSGQWGGTAKDVVQYPGQFSAWNKVTGYGGGAGGNSLVNNVDPKTYARLGQTVDDVFSGKIADPTKGALNFYAPGGMPGGKPPGWWSQVSNPIHIGAQWYGTAPGENAQVTHGTTLTSVPLAANSDQPLPSPGQQARPYTPTPQSAGPAYAGVAPAATTPVPATPEPNFVQKLFTRPPPTKDAQGNDVQGKSPIEKIASGLGGKQGGQQQAAAPQPAQFAPVQDPMAQMAGPAAQLYSTVQAQAAKPLSWSSRPYGWDAGLQMTPGMSLNTTGYG